MKPIIKIILLSATCIAPQLMVTQAHAFWGKTVVSEAESAQDIAYNILDLSDIIGQMDTICHTKPATIVDMLPKLQLQFDAIKTKFIKIKSNNTGIYFENLIYLSQLLSDYCKEFTRINTFILKNSKPCADILLCIQLNTLINSGCNAFNVDALPIINKIKPLLTEEMKTILKEYIEQKFDKDIRDWAKKCSQADNDQSKILMKLHQWPILHMYFVISTPANSEQSLA
jgi:hypothetical protein